MSVQFPSDTFCFEDSCCICSVTALRITASGIGTDYDGVCCCSLAVPPESGGGERCATANFVNANGVFELDPGPANTWTYDELSGPFCEYLGGSSANAPGCLLGQCNTMDPIGDIRVTWTITCVDGILSVTGEAGGNVFFTGSGNITTTGTEVTIANDNSCAECNDDAFPFPQINCTTGTITVEVIA